jgi:hypothetical protein
LALMIGLAMASAGEAGSVDISTGIDGGMIAAGGADDDWDVSAYTPVTFGSDYSTWTAGTPTVLNVDAVVMTNIPGVFFDPTPDAQWITYEDGNNDAGIFTFSYTLDANAGVMHLGAMASGDNPVVDVRIDGAAANWYELGPLPTGPDGRIAPYGQWAYGLADLLEPGQTLEIDVLNYRTSPMGLAVSGAVTTPVPAAAWAGLGLLGLLGVRRRRGRA